MSADCEGRSQPKHLAKHGGREQRVGEHGVERDDVHDSARDAARAARRDDRVLPTHPVDRRDQHQHRNPIDPGPDDLC